MFMLSVACAAARQGHLLRVQSRKRPRPLWDAKREFCSRCGTAILAVADTGGTPVPRRGYQGRKKLGKNRWSSAHAAPPPAVRKACGFPASG